VVVNRERFLLLAAALSASHLAAKPSGANPAPPPPPSPTHASPTFCEAMVRHNDSLLAEPSGWCDGFPSQVEATRAAVAKQRKTNAFFHYCHPGHGTWAVMLVTVELSAPPGEAGGCGWGASYRLVFQPTPDTPLRECPSSVRHDWNQYPDDTSEVTKELVFDYDGDGKDELILAHDSWQNGGGGETGVEVVGAGGSRVAPYDVGFA
jgi:hypothetical protein